MCLRMSKTISTIRSKSWSEKNRNNNRSIYGLKRGICAAGIITMGIILCSGCDKKKVDYNIGNGTATGSDSLTDKEGSLYESGELKAKVNAPDSYEGEIPVGDSGLKSIKIKSDKIEIPDTSTMSVIYCSRVDGGADFKKKIVESSFDIDKGIYIEDHKHVYKDDLDLIIEADERGYDAAMAAGDTDMAESYSEALAEYRNDAQNVVSARTPLTDYNGIDSMSDVVGYRGDELYSFSFSGGESSGFGVSADMNVYPSKRLCDLRPIGDDLGCVNVSFYDSGNEETGVDNKSEMSAEEAQAVAYEYFDSLGLSDMKLSYCTDMYWNYYDYKNDVIAEEADGYVISMNRTVNGIEIYNPYLLNIDYFDTSGDVGYLITNENFKAYVYDGQVISANITLGISQEDEESNVSLLSWDDILEAAKTGIPEYYGNLDNKTGYLDITFDEVKLTYYRIKNTEIDENGVEIVKGYKIIPAWAFICTDAGKNGDTTIVGAGAKDMYPFQLVIINAMDGSVIDLTHEVEY